MSHENQSRNCMRAKHHTNAFTIFTTTARVCVCVCWFDWMRRVCEPMFVMSHRTSSDTKKTHTHQQQQQLCKRHDGEPRIACIWDGAATRFPRDKCGSHVDSHSWTGTHKHTHTLWSRTVAGNNNPRCLAQRQFSRSTRRRPLNMNDSRCYLQRGAQCAIASRERARSIDHISLLPNSFKTLVYYMYIYI